MRRRRRRKGISNSRIMDHTRETQNHETMISLPMVTYRGVGSSSALTLTRTLVATPLNRGGSHVDEI